MTSIDSRSFSGCKNLKNIAGPAAITVKIVEQANPTSFAVVITSGISIDHSAFRNRTGLTSVIIPDSVTSIADYAFYGCRGLTSVIIPDSVMSIGNYAFYGCTKLTDVTLLPTTPSTLGSNAFNDISSSAVITIPKGTLEAYKAATNWSTYADKMVEATE